MAAIPTPSDPPRGRRGERVRRFGQPSPEFGQPSQESDTSPAASGDKAASAESAEPSPEEIRDRLRRRAIFLRELAEARELRRRVAPRRSRRAAIHAALRMRTFRID